ncbi:hypothetical protein CMO91_05480 [Candidatus Woesearchaeota archaeon]|nr:hypothetical protein [Candidatus Woesearchaeota archaeon]|tara:strand:- start:794 stop:1009 length:216 start_codon:yes stop_codon:yes gene_type:complete
MPEIVWENRILPVQYLFESLGFNEWEGEREEGMFTQKMRRSRPLNSAIEVDYEGMWEPDCFTLKVIETVDD